MSLPPRDQLLPVIRALFRATGAHNLSMNALRAHLQVSFGIDFRPHTARLSQLVNEVMADPAMAAFIAEAQMLSVNQTGSNDESDSDEDAGSDVDVDGKRTRAAKEKDDPEEGEGQRSMKRARVDNNQAAAAAADS